LRYIELKPDPLPPFDINSTIEGLSFPFNFLMDKCFEETASLALNTPNNGVSSYMMKLSKFPCVSCKSVTKP
jgi:hypothetical protein